jgi:hypothetical protein
MSNLSNLCLRSSPVCFHLLLFLVLLSVSDSTHAARVTLITHGFNASVDEWIVPMANRMAGYTSFHGADASIYQLTVATNAGGQFVVTTEFLDGKPAGESTSGNLFLLLDWSNVAGSFVSFLEIYPARFTVTQIAEVVTPALLNPALLADLNGRALAEFPLHLIGHSRGGPLISELARLLGAQGVWVDQLTMLDPHPCDPADPLEAIGCPVLDAQPAIFANVRFADNYWQNLGSGIDLKGQPVPGAYNRQLLALPGGYSLNHSDTHLWYHGTIDFATPAFDGGASLTLADRATWFAAGETNGWQAGFLYSRIGGGDRASTNRPAGAATAAINEGLLGHRQTLPANDGTWPNVIELRAANTGRFHFQSEPGLAVREENVAYRAGGLTVTAEYQSGTPATWTLFLDPDANELNGNEIILGEESLAATGIHTVSNLVRRVTLDANQVVYGIYHLGARITGGQPGARRVQYAAQKVAVLAPLRLAIGNAGSGQGQLRVTGSGGYSAAIEVTDDFANWERARGVSFPGFLGGNFNQPITAHVELFFIDPALFIRAIYLRPPP